MATIPQRPVVGAGPVTTLVVSNVSRKVTQVQVMRQWPSHIYNYDFLHMPADFTKGRFAGRVYINFVTAQDAEAFRNTWNSRPILGLSTTDELGNTQPIEIEDAQRQGFRTNVLYWRRVLPLDVCAAVAPVVCFGGVRYDFFEFVRTLLA